MRERKAALEALRRQVASIEGVARVEAGAGACEVGEGDYRFLPGLLRGLHRVEAAHPDRPASAGFALAFLVASGRRPVLWAFTSGIEREWGRPSAQGLRCGGLDPAGFVFLRGRHDREVLCALEEGVRSRSFQAVIGEAEAGFAGQRRLSLLAAEHGVLTLLLRGIEAGGSPAFARWRVALRASAPDPFDACAPGLPRWRVELVRCRVGPPGAWTVEWDHAAGRLRLVAELAPAAAAPRQRYGT